MNSKLVTVSQMQQLEAAADASGHSYTTMMEIAGRAVANTIVARDSVATPPMEQSEAAPLSTSKKTILILVGPGNNGGDGLVCAQHLATARSGQPNGPLERCPNGNDIHGRLTVRVYLWRRATEPSQDYQHHLAKATALDIDVAHADNDPNLSQLRAWLADSEIVVDALLGTGNQRAISGTLAKILDEVRVAKAQQSLAVVAVDCPSGLHCDSGEVDPHTVPAELTITFGYAKWGHHIFPGASVIGQLEVANIGIAPALDSTIQTFLLQPQWLAHIAPKRHVNSHKGTFGKAMIAAGCINYPGAAFLACAAAGRVGAGLITGAVPASIWPIVAGRLAEPTWLPFSTEGSADMQRTHLQKKDAAPLVEALRGYTAFLLGCGLGQSANTLAFVDAMLAHSDELPPMLIDADGLNLLAQLDGWQARVPKSTLLTPHPAEMSRLCRMDVEEVRQNRWALAKEKAAEWNVVVLLKGPYTVIAAPDGRLAVLPVATPALATAGTGDVLSGTIIGLMAQGLAAFDAACLGAWIHGKAGERCGKEIGLAGVIASDLLERLAIELNALIHTGLTQALASIR